ncbi:MAG: acyl-CoA thioesterase [Anaerolineae bacterium]
MIALDQLDALPMTHRITIPDTFLDEMGHMNVMYYMHIFDRAAWGIFNVFGVTFKDVERTQLGMFALRQVITYLAEVHVGQTVAVRSRVLAVSAKRLHFMHFMVNETTGVLACTLEALASQADLRIRRSAAFPEDIRVRIEALVEAHSQLGWDAPVSGILQV